MAKFRTRFQLGSVGLLILMLSILSGCAHMRSNPTPEASPEPVAQSATPAASQPSDLSDIRSMLSTMNARLEKMESKLPEKTGSSNVKTLPQGTQAVMGHPSQGTGEDVEAKTHHSDPEVGFAQDGSIQAFRKGIIFFESQKYSEALLAFSSFVEKYPDHVLAGAAQFYVGESYFQQKEYKLARKEYEGVLTTYDRSSHVTFALARMVQIEEALGMQEEAAHHHQLLTSLFPGSPAAAWIQTKLPVQTQSPSTSQTPAPITTAPTTVEHVSSGAALDAPPSAEVPATAPMAAPAPANVPQNAPKTEEQPE